MQRVVRSTLVGALTIAGLAACGDKVTVPPPTSAVVDASIHQVIVSPNTVNMQVGQKVTLAASVDAGPGATVRTVTWSSSNTAVVTVDGTGIVTAVGPGTATVLAAATADPNVKGAAAITVGGGGTPSISIASTNTTVCVPNGGCNSVPANLSNFGTGTGIGFTGQLDVTANVDANGNTLKSVTGTLTCAGKTQTVTQNLSVAPAAGADENAAPVALTFQTAAFDANGVPALFNTGAFNVKNQATPACSLQVTVTPVSGAPVNASALSVTLNNLDVAVLTTKTSNATSQPDANGLPWFTGDVTISALPVLYSQRTATSLLIAINPASNLAAGSASQTVPAAATGATSATWSSTSTTGPNVVQLTLNNTDANGFPSGITPTVTVIDNAGNSAALPAGNPASAWSLRIDDQSPQAPLTFQIPQGQGQWVNGTYVFSTLTATNTAANLKYVACGDAPAAPATVSPAGTNACVAQGGVGKGTIAQNNVPANAAANPQTTLKFFAFDVTTGATVPATLKDGSGNVIGTSTSTTTCSAASTANGWIDISTNAGALTEGPTNTRYIVRAVETDKLGNIRCSDLSTTTNTINTIGAPRATIGSDKTPPTVPNGRFANNNEDPNAANDQSTYGIAQPLLSFIFSASDNLSGFSSTPVNGKMTRFDAANAAACVIGSGSSCNPAARAISPVLVDNGSGLDGYYTYTASVQDLAVNVTTLPSRTVLVDRAAPVLGGIQVPATISGGQSVNFATSATDNLDLISSDFTLAYPVTASGASTALAIRAAGPSLGVAFDNTLTTAASYSYTVAAFTRTVSVTDAAGTPTFAPQRPTSVTGRAYDGANNASAPSAGTITAANIPIPGSGTGAQTNFTAAQSNGAQFCGIVVCAGTPPGFAVTNVATQVSNCPAAGCAGGAAPAHATTVNLIAQSSGNETSVAPAFQFLNPFPSGVSFYYQDPVSGEWILIGTVAAPSVSDNVAATVRTFTWTFAAFDPPAVFGAPATVNIIAVGTNTLGDALVTAQNANITLTNP